MLRQYLPHGTDLSLHSRAKLSAVARRLPPASVVAMPEGPGLAGSLVQLAAHACKWPLGDPKAEDFSFCGPRTEFGPYCAGHQQTAHQPRRLRPLTDDPLVRRVLAGLAA